MEIRWKLGLLVVLLGCIAALRTSAPNQKLIIQFSDASISLEERQQTLDRVKAQLRAFGASQFQIDQSDDGTLSISYHSTVEVEKVQRNLSEYYHLRLAYGDGKENSSDTPERDTSNDFEFNISEIHQTVNPDWDFDGVQLIEYQQKSDRLLQLKKNSSKAVLAEKQFSKLTKSKANYNINVVLGFDNGLYRIPEVRAGPAKKDMIF